MHSRALPLRYGCQRRLYHQQCWRDSGWPGMFQVTGSGRFSVTLRKSIVLPTSCFSFFPTVSPEGLLGWQQFAVDLASVLSGLAKKPNVEHKTHFPLKVLFNPYHLLLFPCLPNSQQQDWWSCTKKTFLKRAFWWTGVDPRRILLPKFSNHFCQNLSSCRAATLVYACPHVHMHIECTQMCIIYIYIYAVFTKNWY